MVISSKKYYRKHFQIMERWCYNANVCYSWIDCIQHPTLAIIRRQDGVWMAPGPSQWGRLQQWCPILLGLQLDKFSILLGLTCCKVMILSHCSVCYRWSRLINARWEITFWLRWADRILGRISRIELRYIRQHWHLDFRVLIPYRHWE